MNSDIYLYYCLNQTNQNVKTNKEGIKSINILYVPEHISLRLLYNQATPEGIVYPIEKRYVTFPDHLELYRIVYDMLFPKLNMSMAISYVEYNIEVIRKMAVAIVRRHAERLDFDDWLDCDSNSYLSLRP